MLIDKKTDIQIVIDLLNKTKFNKIVWKTQMFNSIDHVYQFKTYLEINGVNEKKLELELFINKKHNVFSYLKIFLKYKDYIYFVKEIGNDDYVLESLLISIIKKIKTDDDI